MFNPENFFNCDNHIYKDIFRDAQYVWEGLNNITKYLKENINPNITGVAQSGPLVTDTKILSNGAVIYAGAYLMSQDIEIGQNSIVEPGACIIGPAIIGADTVIRQSAYFRGNVIVGDSCVVGHATEIKHSVMLGKSKAGHFAYIGDSILGQVNLGAGTKLANLKITESKVTVTVNGKKYKTNLRKFGAILADGVETGCNSVTAPGTILSKGVILYPNVSIRGYYPQKTIIKLRQKIEQGELK